MHFKGAVSFRSVIPNQTMHSDLIILYAKYSLYIQLLV